MILTNSKRAGKCPIIINSKQSSPRYLNKYLNIIKVCFTTANAAPLCVYSFLFFPRFRTIRRREEKRVCLCLYVSVYVWYLAIGFGQESSRSRCLTMS